MLHLVVTSLDFLLLRQLHEVSAPLLASRFVFSIKITKLTKTLYKVTILLSITNSMTVLYLL